MPDLRTSAQERQAALRQLGRERRLAPTAVVSSATTRAVAGRPARGIQSAGGRRALDLQLAQGGPRVERGDVRRGGLAGREPCVVGGDVEGRALLALRDHDRRAARGTVADQLADDALRLSE